MIKTWSFCLTLSVLESLTMHVVEICCLKMMCPRAFTSLFSSLFYAHTKYFVGPRPHASMTMTMKHAMSLTLIVVLVCVSSFLNVFAVT